MKGMGPFRGLLLPQGGRFHGGCTPILFLVAPKREPSRGASLAPAGQFTFCAAPGGREKALVRAPAPSCLRAITGVDVSVQTPIWAGLQARYALLRFLILPSRGGWCGPRRGGHRIDQLRFPLPLAGRRLGEL